MKLIRIFTLSTLLCLVQFEAGAVNKNDKKPVAANAITQSLTARLTVNQFLAMDLDQLNTKSTVKIGWAKKTILKYAQKNLAKKVAKGKLDGHAALMKAAPGSKSGSNNKRGMWSLILGGLGLIILFINPIGWLALPMAIAGLIFGILGAKRDANSTMSVIGIVLSGLVLLLFLLLAALVASFFLAF